jgi:alpha-D-ribose 1-methylphosphonate 5-triphosphate synthase subunit PhnG
MSAQAFQVLRSDKSRAVRLAVLDILWQVRDRFPEVDSLVKTAAKDEADREVREAAVRPVASIQ